MDTVMNPQTNSNLYDNSKRTREKPVYDFIKRLFDIIFSLVAIVLLSPLILILGIAVKSTSEGPVIFAHKRVGKGGKTISIYKFRSMVVNAEELIKKFTWNKKLSLKKTSSLTMTRELQKSVIF